MNASLLRYRTFWPLVPAIAMVMVDFTIAAYVGAIRSGKQERIEG